MFIANRWPAANSLPRHTTRCISAPYLGYHSSSYQVHSISLSHVLLCSNPYQLVRTLTSPASRNVQSTPPLWHRLLAQKVIPLVPCYPVRIPPLASLTDIQEVIWCSWTLLSRLSGKQVGPWMSRSEETRSALETTADMWSLMPKSKLGISRPHTANYSTA